MEREDITLRAELVELSAIVATLDRMQVHPQQKSTRFESELKTNPRAKHGQLEQAHRANIREWRAASGAARAAVGEFRFGWNSFER